MSHEIITEIISLMGQSILRMILKKINGSNPSWYAVICDETTDVACKEQLNLSIRYVDDNYVVHEDAVGLFNPPNTCAPTLSEALKDILVRCNLPLSMCRGQAYDGAAAMQGKRKGLATLIRSECPAAVSVHCFAHCLNLCLQDASRTIPLIRDTFDVVREIEKLILWSPKRKHLFSTQMQSHVTENESGYSVGLRRLCPTRWTMRAASMDSVIKYYSVIIDTMEEVHRTTRDDYGLRANGILAALDKYEVYFGIKLSNLLFGPAEEVSKVLQAKNISLPESLVSINTVKHFYERQRRDEAFDSFFDKVVEEAKLLKIGQPKLPRHRKAPKKLEESEPHQFTTPKSFFRQVYFESCDLLINELQSRFEQPYIEPVLTIERLLMKAANKENIENEIGILKESIYKEDFDFAVLERQVPVITDVIHQVLPSVRKVTSIRTVCDALMEHSYRQMLSEVHKLLRLYLTIPVTSSTSERTFSTLRRLLTYLRSTMTEKRLNNCLLLHVHKDLTDSLNLQDIALQFISVNDERRKYFGSFPC